MLLLKVCGTLGGYPGGEEPMQGAFWQLHLPNVPGMDYAVRDVFWPQ